MIFEELQKKVLQWANDRNLLQKDNSLKQFTKSVSEMGELGDALLKDDKNGIIDGIGDVVVTLIILANQNNYDLNYCLNEAYKEIKDRKGKTVNGTFIKEG